MKGITDVMRYREDINAVFARNKRIYVNEHAARMRIAAHVLDYDRYMHALGESIEFYADDDVSNIIDSEKYIRGLLNEATFYETERIICDYCREHPYTKPEIGFLMDHFAVDDNDRLDIFSGRNMHFEAIVQQMCISVMSPNEYMYCIEW